MIKKFFRTYKNPFPVIFAVIIVDGSLIALLITCGCRYRGSDTSTIAIAVIGGFVIALPLLLIIFPTLLHLLHKEEDRKQIISVQHKNINYR
jgi:hypothetical protein